MLRYDVALSNYCVTDEVEQNPNTHKAAAAAATIFKTRVHDLQYYERHGSSWIPPDLGAHNHDGSDEEEPLAAALQALPSNQGSAFLRPAL